MKLVTFSAVCLTVMSIWGGAFADPTPFPEFSAKRVKPPSRSAKKRITVQITPKSQEDAATGATQPAAPASAGATTVSWFWESVSPELSQKGPGRLEPALIRLMNPPSGQGIAAPRLQLLQDIAQSYGKDILLSSVGTRVSPALALAVIAVESAGRASAESSAGAQGLMQLMPATAERFGVSDSFAASQNIKGGIAYLDFLMEKFDNDPILTLAAYNAGENAVIKNGGVPEYPETRAYVPKVLQAFQSARGLCMTPPELVTDGCVFRISSR